MKYLILSFIFFLLSPFFFKALSAQCRIFYTPAHEFDLSQMQWKVSSQASLSNATRRYTNDTSWQSAYLNQSWSSLGTNFSPENIWYRCFVHIKDDRLHTKAIYLGRLDPADKVFFNGSLVGETGDFSKKRYDFGKERLYSIPANLWQKGDNLIAIHLAGSAAATKGISAARIVDEDYMARRLILQDIPKIISSLACILLAILIALFYFSSNQRESIYLSLFSACLGSYYLLQTWMRYEIFDSFSASYVKELFLLFCCLPLLIEYIQQVTAQKRHKYSYFFYGSSGLLAALLIFLPGNPVIWDYLVKLNLLLIAAAAFFIIWIFWSRKNEKKMPLRYLRAGILFLILFIIWDTLSVLELHSFQRLSSFGFLLFICNALLQNTKSINILYNEMLSSEKQTRLVEKRKTQSIYNISQEFDNNLQSLLLLVQNIHQKQATAGGNGKKADSLMQAAIIGLENLIRDSDQLKALESGMYIPKHVTIDLDEFCKEVLQRALITTEQNKNRVKLKIDKKTNMILSDPGLLSLAFYHLLENALLYTEGKVECSLESTPQELKLTIVDAGPGLNVEQRKQAFQKFSRAVSSATKIKGQGIGLTLASLAVHNLRGRLEFDNNHGFFSRFILSIPTN